MKRNYETFCETLNTLDIPLQDKMKIQQAAFTLTRDEYKKGFDAAAEMALNSLKLT
mgnify:CR=1 FL=1|tara:strand:+ start:3625 stop:3792 length:168 start_codon:yes stop_codon:yes gene_type:complete